MRVVCLDLEGVLVPEIWINVAEKTGIEELRLTTRDIPDYDVLMNKRLGILDEHRLTLKDIQEVIASMSPLPGAGDFLEELRGAYQVIILSDTFDQFAAPLMRQLHWPTLFCNTLEVNDSHRITGYCLRQQDGKRKAVEALRSLNMRIIASGDSYNDISMLTAAHAGVLFCPPENIIAEYPEFPVTREYNDLRHEIDRSFAAIHV
ncbi:bifunctional phosphoserine phosphatase/homoserine phosphotransferase ThrH [Marispirochaeta sp.]|jgi:phosphoserine / homoserine phosphotransferase|uniref:bifunctional phosphoserine phosphatase/homoserine phosphotransferase ThrH n=1 Tax=Marispirochaeta sp. TaxID=2038653 RepID=UPI0029C8F2AB|nr:bifunctional phosphoserine phosphatase/homoserine phosphotransferase ThrH [Marispirochaeta sp.]